MWTTSIHALRPGKMDIELFKEKKIRYFETLRITSRKTVRHIPEDAIFTRKTELVS